MSLELKDADFTGPVMIGVLHSHLDYREKSVEGEEGHVFEAWTSKPKDTIYTKVFIPTVNYVRVAVVHLSKQRVVQMKFNTTSMSVFGIN